MYYIIRNIIFTSTKKCLNIIFYNVFENLNYSFKTTGVFRYIKRYFNNLNCFCFFVFTDII